MPSREWIALWLLHVAVAAGADLNPVALRLIGQPRNFTNGMNLVEGRELAGPLGLALDLSPDPPRLYVADTLNNRVLAWRDAARFGNGAMADLVIGQPDFLSTGANVPGVALGLSQPSGVAVDAAGNLYIADTGNHRVLRYPEPFEQRIRAPNLVIGQTSLATRERNMGAAETTDSALSSPSAIALNARGDLAVSDAGNRRVFLFAAGSLVVNGPPAAVVLGAIDQPAGLAFDAAGRLYVADVAMNRVLQFPATPTTGATPARVIGGNRDDAIRGPHTLLHPLGVAAAGEDLLIVDTGNHRLLFFHDFNRAPESRPVADSLFGQSSFTASVPNGGSRRIPEASAQSLSSPAQVVFGRNGELFVADAGNHRVVAIPAAPSGRYQEAARVLGQDRFNQTAPNLVEGREVSTSNLLPTAAGLLFASGGIAVDASAPVPLVYVADTANHRVLGWRDVRRLREGMRADLVIGQPDFETAIANYGAPLAENRPATASNLSRPSGLALDSAGNLYVPDTGNNRILRFPRPFEQTIQRADLVIGQPALAGSPVEGAAAFLLNRPTGIAVHPERGDLLVADTLNHRVLYFPAPLASGMAATRVFGQSSFTDSTRGLSSAGLSFPTAVAFDSDENAYVSDTGNSRILVFGRLRDLPAAGAAALASGAAPIGQSNFVTATGGTASNRLRNPSAISVDWSSGDLWVADTGNHRVLRFPPLGVLALNGGTAYVSGGLIGQATFATRTPNLGAAVTGQTSPSGLNFPNALALDPAGNPLVGDGNSRVLLYFPQAVSVSAATYLAGAPLAPGMLGSLFGSDLSQDTARSGLPLVTTLADTQLLINDSPAPLLYVSPRQINYQLPSSLAPGTLARVEVARVSSGRAVAGGTLLVAPAAAGIFGVLNEDGSANSASNAAARGSVIQIFATGQGVVRNPPPDGGPAAASPLAETPGRPLITIGTSSERDVTAEFSGLAPGFVGLWQINARVPAVTVPGPRVPVVVRYGGSASNVVFIAVR